MNTPRLCLYCHMPFDYKEKAGQARFYCSSECQALGTDPPLVECAVCGQSYFKITINWRHCPLTEENL